MPIQSKSRAVINPGSANSVHLMHRPMVSFSLCIVLSKALYAERLIAASSFLLYASSVHVYCIGTATIESNAYPGAISPDGLLVHHTYIKFLTIRCSKPLYLAAPFRNSNVFSISAGLNCC